MDKSKTSPDCVRLIAERSLAGQQDYADAAMHVCYSCDTVAVSVDRHAPALGTTLSTPTPRLCSRT